MNSEIFDKNRASWKFADYIPISAIAAFGPTNPSMKRLYHLTDADHAISDIALRRLKVARFSDLNDPFELIGANFREREVRKVIRGFKSAFDAEMGLLCFSEDWKEPLLWSHYGDRHRGICLGFNVPLSQVDRVDYQSERILAVLGADGDPTWLSPELKLALLRTKYVHWKYEQEFRQFVELKTATPEGRLHYVGFSSNLELAEVILGSECLLDLNAIRSLVQLEHPNVSVYRARLEFKGFHIVPEELTIPGTNSDNWKATSAPSR